MNKRDLWADVSQWQRELEELCEFASHGRNNDLRLPHGNAQHCICHKIREITDAAYQRGFAAGRAASGPDEGEGRRE